MNDFSRYAPWLGVAIGVLTLGYAMLPQAAEPADQMHLSELGAIPVVDHGRIKPFDSFARSTLFVLSDRQTYVDENETTQAAVKWAMDVISSRRLENGVPVSHTYQVFRITNDELLGFLGLELRPGLRYSFIEVLHTRKDTGQRLDEASERINQKQELAQTLDLFENDLQSLVSNLNTFRAMETGRVPLVAPPEREEQQWASTRGTLIVDSTGRELGTDPQRPAAAAFRQVRHSYLAGQVDRFNDAVADYGKRVTAILSPKENDRVGLELWLNQFEPFYVCCLLYTIVFLLACVSWVSWPETLTRAAFWLTVVTLVAHTGALLARMFLMARPLVFVTNLYSSAIFIGWGCVGLGLLLERLFRNGIGITVGAAMGALSLIVAHNVIVFSPGGDTLGMMQAVLDTNFWLATHVSCVTIGYTATFVAGFLGLVFVIRGVMTKSLTPPLMKSLSQMLYGIICFAMLFSFVGTVLGGIWADQSWGRFWGWDPKENGAMLIVIWNALLLHARWGGMVKQRGMAVLAIAGNIVTSWSWFGTNLLGVGLHAYGFLNGAAFWLLGWVFLNLAVIGIGTLPLRMWASFAEAPKAEEPSPPSTGKRDRKSKHAPTAIQPA